MSDFSLQAGGTILTWPIILAIAIGVLAYFQIESDAIAGGIGLIIGCVCVSANKRRFEGHWHPADLTARQKSRFMLSIKLLLAAAGIALIVMAQLTPDVLYARWSPSTGWLTRQGGPNSHALITYFGSAVLGVALALPFRRKAET